MSTDNNDNLKEETLEANEGAQIPEKKRGGVRPGAGRPKGSGAKVSFEDLVDEAGGVTLVKLAPKVYRVLEHALNSSFPGERKWAVDRILRYAFTEPKGELGPGVVTLTVVYQGGLPPALEEIDKDATRKR